MFYLHTYWLIIIKDTKQHSDHTCKWQQIASRQIPRNLQKVQIMYNILKQKLLMKDSLGKREIQTTERETENDTWWYVKSDYLPWKIIEKCCYRLGWGGVMQSSISCFKVDYSVLNSSRTSSIVVIDPVLYLLTWILLWIVPSQTSMMLRVFFIGVTIWVPALGAVDKQFLR